MPSPEAGRATARTTCLATADPVHVTHRLDFKRLHVH